jgi:hypothetical protein
MRTGSVGIGRRVTDVPVISPVRSSTQDGIVKSMKPMTTLVDVLMLDLTAGDPQVHAVMQARHANLE